MELSRKVLDNGEIVVYACDNYVIKQFIPYSSTLDSCSLMEILGLVSFALPHTQPKFDVNIYPISVYTLRGEGLVDDRNHNFAKCILRTLATMHNSEVCHGDVKLDNIVRYNDYYQLIDYENTISVYSKHVGYSNGYRPPEGSISPSGDIWAFGITYLRYILNNDKANKYHVGLVENSKARSIIKSCLRQEPHRRKSAIQLLYDLDDDFTLNYRREADKQFTRAFELHDKYYPQLPHDELLRNILLQELLTKYNDVISNNILADAFMILILYTIIKPIYTDNLVSTAVAFASIIHGSHLDNPSVRNSMFELCYCITLPIPNILTYTSRKVLLKDAMRILANVRTDRLKDGLSVLNGSSEVSRTTR